MIEIKNRFTGAVLKTIDAANPPQPFPRTFHPQFQALRSAILGPEDHATDIQAYDRDAQGEVLLIATCDPLKGTLETKLLLVRENQPLNP